MDMREMFRRFFGFKDRPGSGHSSVPPFFDDYSADNDVPLPDDDGNDNDGFSFFDFGPSRKDHGGLQDMFEHFHGDIWRQMDALHQQMDEMMKGFGKIDFPSAFDQPALPPSVPSNPDGKRKDGQVFIWSNTSPFFGNNGEKKKMTPRDFMLKEDVDVQEERPAKPQVPALPTPPMPDTNRDGSLFGDIFNPQRKRQSPSVDIEDTDLDGKIPENKILDLIKKPQQDEGELRQRSPESRRPLFYSSGKSCSVSTVRRQDGTMEQKKVCRDSTGREESTVTKSLGNKSYTVTTITDKDGRQERHESFHNMDEKDMHIFGSHLKKPDQPALESHDNDLFAKLFGKK